MIPVEAAFVDPVFGFTVLSFDGVVLERFALGATAQGVRFHKSMITVAVEGPSRKGHLTVRCGLRGAPGGFDSHLEAQHGALLDPLLDALVQAGVPVQRQP